MWDILKSTPSNGSRNLTLHLSPLSKVHQRSQMGIAYCRSIHLTLR